MINCEIEEDGHDGILVYGAGVLGCNLARDFFKAGKDVTLLARGKWAETIKTNGLCIKNYVLPVKLTVRVPVVTELASEDEYDVIFVAARYTQVATILDALRANKSKTLFSWAIMCSQRNW